MPHARRRAPKLARASTKRREGVDPRLPRSNSAMKRVIFFVAAQRSGSGFSTSPLRQREPSRCVGGPGACKRRGRATPRPTIAPSAAARKAESEAGGARGEPAPHRLCLVYDTGSVVSENAACSGTSKRATPIRLVLTVPATVLPSPVPVPDREVERRVARQPADAVRGRLGRRPRSASAPRCPARRPSRRRRGRRMPHELLLELVVVRAPDAAVDVDRPVVRLHGSTRTICQPGSSCGTAAPWRGTSA